MAKYPFLPIFSDETFVSIDTATSQGIQDTLGCKAFIGVGRHQLVNDRNAIQGTERNQFVAIVFQITASTNTIVCILHNHALLFRLYPHRDRLGIQK